MDKNEIQPVIKLFNLEGKPVWVIQSGTVTVFMNASPSISIVNCLVAEF